MFLRMSGRSSENWIIPMAHYVKDKAPRATVSIEAQLQLKLQQRVKLCFGDELKQGNMN